MVPLHSCVVFVDTWISAGSNGPSQAVVECDHRSRAPWNIQVELWHGEP